MDFLNNHTRLFTTALLLFVLLTSVVAVIPALKNQENNAPLPTMRELSEDEAEGKKIYIANGCVGCHTQQVRNIDMDKPWGKRPGIPADYALNERMDFWRNTATLMGTERTGPDLTNTGIRQPGLEWNLLHLYQPRALVSQSVMPAYPWLFEEKASVEAGDVAVNVPEEYLRNPGRKIVATKQALQLVAYLQSLKQADLPDGSQPMPFLYERKQNTTESAEGLPDGQQVYAAHCQSCHQANGEGLKGAFPPLKGSPIVLGDDLPLYISVIMKGYDARAEYASMPAVGTNSNLTAEEITALINHERSSWGNSAPPVSKEEVKKILSTIQ